MAQSITEVVSPSNTQTQVHSWQAISISNGKFVAQLPADVRPTFLDFQKHHRTDEVVKAVNDFFLEHWPFKTSKHRQRFVNEGLPCYVCALYPLSLDERLQWDCRLLTLGFLIDDLLDGMSLEEGKAFNSKIVKCARGMTHPDRVVPAQWIRYDTFNEMRALDKPLADDVLQYVVGWLLAQDGKKFMPMDSKEYFHFRDADFGRGWVSSLSQSFQKR
jgi:aristolochene synthase